jgi:transposase-like protein
MAANPSDVRKPGDVAGVPYNKNNDLGLTRKPTSSSTRDETYVKVAGQWAYLYRAIDKNGEIIDFMLSPRRTAKPARRFVG